MERLLSPGFKKLSCQGECHCATFTLSETIVCIIMFEYHFVLNRADYSLSQQYVADLESHVQGYSLKKHHKCSLISISHITKTSPLIRYAVCNIKCILYFDASHPTWN